jgi:hypothetical protein
MAHHESCTCEDCCYESGFNDGAGVKEAYCNLYPEYFQVVAYNEGFDDATRLKGEK